jgi:hypothetical protein
MFSDEIVSCYKDPAELVLFHDVEMKGHSGREHPLEVGQGLPGSNVVAFERAATSAVKKIVQNHQKQCSVTPSSLRYSP